MRRHPAAAGGMPPMHVIIMEHLHEHGSLGYQRQSDPQQQYRPRRPMRAGGDGPDDGVRETQRPADGALPGLPGRAKTPTVRGAETMRRPWRNSSARPRPSSWEPTRPTAAWMRESKIFMERMYCLRHRAGLNKARWALRSSPPPVHPTSPACRPPPRPPPPRSASG